MARARARGARGQTQSRRASAKGKAPAGAVASVDEDNTPQITSSAAPPANTTRKPIQWEKAYSARTSRLIAWCRDNEDSRIKLFSDSVKDAKDQGRKKKQSGIPKETYYLQLTDSIFANDEDPETRLLFQQNPKAFIKPVQTRFGILKKKYNEVNATLKQTGAGMTFDDLQKDPKTKTLLDSQLEKFPWWTELHGWWRTNPAYNTVSSSADPGQDFESAALQHFNVSSSKDTQVADENALDDEENIPEDGEILDMDETDIHQGDVSPVTVAEKITTDDVMMPADQFYRMQQPPSSRSSSSAPSITHASFPLTFSPFQRLRPPITPISTHPFDDSNTVSLNSPEPLAPDDSDIQSDGPLLFSNLGTSTSTSTREATPQDSEDSDFSARHGMQGLRVDSRKPSPVQGHSASQIMKLSGTSTRSGSPQSVPATRPSSRKRANNNQISSATEQLSDTAQALIQSISEKRDNRAEHDRVKRMKLERDIWSRDLKIRDARDEREHVLRLAEQDFMHKRDLMDQQMEKTKLELELTRAHREEEEMRIRRIAMERGMDSEN